MRATDAESFRDFAVAWWLPLKRVAFLMVGDEGHAEDLVQSVLAKLWFAWPRLREEAPEAYARRAIVNASTSFWRRRWHGEQPTAALPDRSDAFDFTRSVDDRQALKNALARLPARQRAAVVLRFVDDLSERQVADALGCTVGNVKSLTSRGLSSLRMAAGVESTPSNTPLSRTEQHHA